MGVNKMNRDNLVKARAAKNDEFYSPRELVYDELPNYDFKDKIILCPFDDYTWSEFVKYFKDNFKELGIKKIIATSLSNKKFEYDGVSETITDIDGDFFSKDVKQLIEESDIIVSNPPFSISKDIYKYLYSFDIDFLLVGSYLQYVNCYIINKVVSGEIKLGNNRIKSYYFKLPNGETKKVCCNWHTTLTPIKPYKSNYIYTAKFDKDKYKYFDKPYDNILSVDKNADIPIDYDGLMAVPVSAIKHLIDDFEIISSNSTSSFRKICIDGKEVFKRLVIRRKV